MSLYKNSNEDKYFRTINFYLSTFLFCKSIELVNIDRTDPKRSEFVFINTPELEALVDAFNFAKENSPAVMVDARKFVVAIKSLKDKLYQEGRP